jgi:rhamnosyltransferase
MSESIPPASVIVRTKDSARTLGRALSSLRAQTIPSEIIVVDSGSSDGTLAIAQKQADRVLEIDAASFSFGHALNVGAAVARAPIHFALSSHTFAPDNRWIERSLAMYDRSDVAGTSGAPVCPDSHEPLRTTVYQTLSDALSNPTWGFSNTGSSWRAEVWADFPFDEHLQACEDKEWGFRVLGAGWTIAVDPDLLVSATHRRRHGLRHLYSRTSREYAALASLAVTAPYAIRDLLHEWFTDMPADAPYGGWRRRLSYYRFAELLGKYRGLRTSNTPAAPPCREPPLAGTEHTVDGI